MKILVMFIILSLSGCFFKNEKHQTYKPTYKDSDYDGVYDFLESGKRNPFIGELPSLDLKKLKVSFIHNDKSYELCKANILKKKLSSIQKEFINGTYPEEKIVFGKSFEICHHNLDIYKNLKNHITIQVIFLPVIENSFEIKEITKINLQLFDSKFNEITNDLLSEKGSLVTLKINGKNNRFESKRAIKYSLNNIPKNILKEGFVLANTDFLIRKENNNIKLSELRDIIEYENATFHIYNGKTYQTLYPSSAINLENFLQHFDKNVILSKNHEVLYFMDRHTSVDLINSTTLQDYSLGAWTYISSAISLEPGSTHSLLFSSIADIKNFATKKQVVYEAKTKNGITLENINVKKGIKYFFKLTGTLRTPFPETINATSTGRFWLCEYEPSGGPHSWDNESLKEGQSCRWRDNKSCPIIKSVVGYHEKIIDFKSLDEIFINSINPKLMALNGVLKNDEYSFSFIAQEDSSLSIKLMDTPVKGSFTTKLHRLRADCGYRFEFIPQIPSITHKKQDELDLKLQILTGGDHIN